MFPRALFRPTFASRCSFVRGVSGGGGGRRKFEIASTRKYTLRGAMCRVFIGDAVSRGKVRIAAFSGKCRCSEGVCRVLSGGGRRRKREISGLVRQHVPV